MPRQLDVTAQLTESHHQIRERYDRFRRRIGN